MPVDILKKGLVKKSPRSDYAMQSLYWTATGTAGVLAGDFAAQKSGFKDGIPYLLFLVGGAFVTNLAIPYGYLQMAGDDKDEPRAL